MWQTALALMIAPFGNPPNFLTQIPGNHHQIMPIEFLADA
jgi:hypothetical protein